MPSWAPKGFDATPIDKIKNIPTMASPASVNIGGKHTTKPQSSGALLVLNPHLLLDLQEKPLRRPILRKDYPLSVA